MKALLPADVLVDEVTIEPFTGATGTGPTYGPPVTYRCLLSFRGRLVRRPDAREVTSSCSVIAEPGIDAPPESRATAAGRVTTVIEVRDNVKPDLPTPDHVQLMLE